MMLFFVAVATQFLVSTGSYCLARRTVAEIKGREEWMKKTMSVLCLATAALIGYWVEPWLGLALFALSFLARVERYEHALLSGFTATAFFYSTNLGVLVATLVSMIFSFHAALQYLEGKSFEQVVVGGLVYANAALILFFLMTNIPELELLGFVFMGLFSRWCLS